MRTPMPYDAVPVKRTADLIRPEVRKLPAYRIPPQAAEIKLNQNENPFDIPRTLKEDILREALCIPWCRYPGQNPMTVRQPLGRRLGLPPEYILLSSGSNQLIRPVIRAVLKPDAPLLICRPVFSLFEKTARLEGARLVQIPLTASFDFDSEALLRETAGAALTILCCPNNPTGTVMDLSLLEDILKRTSGLVLWDEAYAEFWGQSACSLIHRYSNLMILRTFSKALGLAGLRVGFLAAHPSIIPQIQKLMMPFDVNVFSLLAARRLLEVGSYIDLQTRKIVRSRNSLSDALNRIPGIRVVPGQANFILFRAARAQTLFKRLKEQSILIRPMDEYPELSGCLRVTVGTDEENALFLEAVKTIQRDLP